MTYISIKVMTKKWENVELIKKKASTAQHITLKLCLLNRFTCFCDRVFFALAFLRTLRQQRNCTNTIAIIMPTNR